MAYTNSFSKNLFTSLIGFGVSTLMFMLFNKKQNQQKQDPDTFKDSNTSDIGKTIPVVLGRGMIKNPFISWYGDYNAEPYTEEYGMHSGLKASPWIILLLITNLIIAFQPREHVVITNTGGGKAIDVKNGIDNQLVASAVVDILIWLLTQLFNKHWGRVTIQKGFLYYLGWQHIICWSGPKIGVRSVWMNVYDPEYKDSTDTSVWTKDGAVDCVTLEDYPNGFSVYIDDDEMFGGPDEQGGFIGNIDLHFGGTSQPFDSWMVSQMNTDDLPSEQADLVGLTPKYPMFLTAVVTNKTKDGGAFIGKQATVPSMWFEVTNYCDNLGVKFKSQLDVGYRNWVMNDVKDVQDYINANISNIANKANANTKISQVQSKLNDLITLQIKDNPSDEEKEKIEQYKEEAYNLLMDIEALLPVDSIPDYDVLISSLVRLFYHGRWTLGRLGDDLNPAEAIYEILMNKSWGCAYTEDRLDLYSLVDLGVTCEVEEMGVSCVIDDISQARDFILKILSHINGVCYDNPITGKLTFTLLRNDYDVDKLKVFDPSNTSEFEFTRLDWSETVSSIEAQFLLANDRYYDNTVVANDGANRYITGTYRQKQVDATYFTTANNAYQYAKSTLLYSAYPLSSATFKCNRYGYDVCIGDPVRIIWPDYGINQVIYRVTDVDYATLTTGEITITAVEDVFTLDKEDFSNLDPPKWEKLTVPPAFIVYKQLYEVPFEMSLSKDTYINIALAQPHATTINWTAWKYDGIDYIKQGTDSNWDVLVKPVIGFEEAYDDNETIEVSLQNINENLMVNLRNGLATNGTTNRSSKNLILVDDEIISFDTIEKRSNGNYYLKGVLRGLYDTIPANHTAESEMYFIGTTHQINGMIDSEGYSSVEKIGITSGTIDEEEEFNEATPEMVKTIETKRRSEAPSIMGNLKFGIDRGTETVYKYEEPITSGGDILFTFNPRNKFNNLGQIVTQTQTTDSTGKDFMFEKDVKVHIKLINSDGTIAEKYINTETTKSVYAGDDLDGNPIYENIDASITSANFTWAEYCTQVGYGYIRTRVEDNITIEVSTYNSNLELESYSTYRKELTYRVPRVVGIIEKQALDVSTYSLAYSYANSIVKSDMVRVPASAFVLETDVPYPQCPIILVGERISSTFIGQDGTYFEGTNKAYRIDGIDSRGKAIIHEITLGNNYVLTSPFGGDKWYYNNAGTWQDIT